MESSLISGDYRPTLLIVKHFAGLKAAEHEVVERLVASTKEIGWIPKVVEVDRNFKYWNIEAIEENVDAVLDIHYEYPKFFKARSVGAVWTPTFFMKDWDLAYVWENQISHDSLVQTDSREVLRLLQQYRPDEVFSILNHSLPSSWVEWVKKAERNAIPKAFYAGINWNKLSGRPGRHHNFFKILDAYDFLDIYGPRKLSHIIPWVGFESYRGEIPFDGKSILLKARESGISLVLSSEEHLNEGVITSRFFEGLAAGNSIISDGHPFIRKHLGKNGNYLNLERGDEYAASQFVDIVSELRQDPDLLARQQSFAEILFMERFDLTKQLNTVITTSPNVKIQPGIHALVVGKLNEDLNIKLNEIGFEKILYTNSKIQDLQDLVSLARGLNLTNFCVISRNSQLLDGFSAHLNELFAKMGAEDARFGSLTTVCLSQGNKKFSPVLFVGNESIAKLNGFLVSMDNIENTISTLTKKVPVLRIHKLHDVSQIYTFYDTYSFLIDASKKLQKSESGIREFLYTQLNTQFKSEGVDIVQRVRSLPRNRKRALVYSLLASLPILRPAALVVKLIMRLFAKLT